jgi:hypothetical protein
MSDTTCQCGEPAQTGCELCRACERKLKHNLADMEAHRRELLTALTRMVRMTAPNDGGRSTPNLAWSSMGDRYLESISEAEVARILATLPPAVKPAQELHAQKSLLVSWARSFMQDNDRLPMPADTVASLSAHLASWLPYIRKHEAAGEFVAEVREQVRRIFTVIDTPANRTRITVGPCPETLAEDGHGEQECPGQVVAIIPADEDIRPTMTCGYCKTEWAPEQWHRAGQRILKRAGKPPATDTEAERELIRRIAC